MIKELLILLFIFGVSSEPLRLYSASTDPDSPYSSVFIGSVKGGTLIYINGVGFDPIATGNQVFIGNYPCEIPAEGVTTNFLVCQTTDSMSKTNVNNLVVRVLALGQESMV